MKYNVHVNYKFVLINDSIFPLVLNFCSLSDWNVYLFSSA